MSTRRWMLFITGIFANPIARGITLAAGTSSTSCCRRAVFSPRQHRSSYRLILCVSACFFSQAAWRKKNVLENLG